jgi:hypothetical protein
MKNKLNYKVKDGYDFSNLKKYGFWKTEPTGNPWWQCVLQSDWSTGLGFFLEDISINIKTNEVFLHVDETIKNCRHHNLIRQMLVDDVLYEIL